MINSRSMQQVPIEEAAFHHGWQFPKVSGTFFQKVYEGETPENLFLWVNKWALKSVGNQTKIYSVVAGESQEPQSEKTFKINQSHNMVFPVGKAVLHHSWQFLKVLGAFFQRVKIMGKNFFLWVTKQIFEKRE